MASTAAPTAQSVEVVTRCLADIETRPVAWLWPRRIPLGHVTTLAGHPGAGKSSFAFDLAARVTRGQSWPGPDGGTCEPGGVLLIMAEDVPESTIRPRFDMAGGDPALVTILDGVAEVDEHGGRRVKPFWMHDIESLHAAIRRTPHCRLVLIDPVGSYLGGDTDAYRDNEVRGQLAPLCDVANAYGLVMVLVAHTRKSGAARADDTVMGSRAFTGIARSVLHLGHDPDDAAQERRLLLPGKMNLCKPPVGLAFWLRPSRPDDPESDPVLVWDDHPVDKTADEAFGMAEATRGRPAREENEAETFLLDALREGPRPAKELIEEARGGFDISQRTLERAKKDLGVAAYRPENPGPWWWRLPLADKFPAKE